MNKTRRRCGQDPNEFGLPDPEGIRDEILRSLQPLDQDLALRGLAKSSRKTVIWVVSRYCTWARAQGIDAERSRREDLLAYLAYMQERGLLRRSMQRMFSCLSTWFAYLEDLGKIERNPVPALQKKYLSKRDGEDRRRQLISVDDAARMVSGTLDTRDHAILMLLLKTGIRRNELVTLDVEDIDLQEQSLRLKPTAKRSNRLLFFDSEAALALHRWLRQREMRNTKKGHEHALFLGYDGTRLKGAGVVDCVAAAAERAGLHDPAAKDIEKRFTPHCCRHWFTTHLLRADMKREYVQWLRGDHDGAAYMIYFHIDPEDVKKRYLAHIPQLGI